MKQLLFIAGLLLAGCQAKPDFTKVKERMTAAEAVALVGEPSKKTPFLFETELWLYEEPNVLLTIRHDTIQDVDLNAKATIDQVNKGLENAPAELDSVMHSE